MYDRITEEERQEIVRNSCPGPGACGGMYTANTMATGEAYRCCYYYYYHHQSPDEIDAYDAIQTCTNYHQTAIEALGMSLPYSSSTPAEDELKVAECKLAGAAIHNLLKLDIKPKDIMTKAAFENAVTLVMVLGGSTNAVLHLIAMARAVDVDLTLDDFQRISEKTPLLADLKPSGKYVMEDLQKYGGTPAVLRYLLDQGRIDGTCLTVTGELLVLYGEPCWDT